MQIKPVSETLSVGAQIEPSDVAGIAAAGYRSIVCNRPDGEVPDQPDFAAIAEEARRHGLEVRYQPVVSGQLTQSDVARFGEALDALPAPVFAYCRTGTRCTALWSLDQGRRGADVEKVMTAARDAGYDMSGLRRQIAAAGGK